MTTSDQPFITRPVDETGVARVLEIDDRVLRNLWITLAYHDLAVGMAGVIGARDVSWVAFATWASQTAGVSIRREQLSDLLRGEWRKTLGKLGTHGKIAAHLSPSHAGIDFDAIVYPIFRQAVDRMSELIAEGNRTVFEELGPTFARMIATCQSGPPTPPATVTFLQSVTALDGGEDAEATPRLREAFGQYFRSVTAVDSATRAQAVLLAGGLVGYTEQIRLQPAIESSLNAIVDVGLHDLLTKALAPFLPFPAGAVPRWLIAAVAADLEAAWRRIVTAFLLRLKTPVAILDLSKDAPRATSTQQFPQDLAAIVDPDTRAFLERHDRTSGTGRPTGAHDWGDLGDRMNYIVNLFRAWQQEATLLHSSPFSDTQIRSMQAGEIPEPPL
jgi:hypothetical protein